MRFLNRILLSFLFICISSYVPAQKYYDLYFERENMKVDFFRVGDKTTEEIVIHNISKGGVWAGNPDFLIDTLRYGKYFYEIVDSISGKVIYARGYNSLFQEYQTTPKAKKEKQSYEESLIFPAPKKTFKIVFYTRDIHQEFNKIKEYLVNPGCYFIKPLKSNFEYETIHGDNQFAKKLDIAIVPDGYTKDEKDKLLEDVKKMKDYFLSQPPFDRFNGDINIRLVYSFSEESGTDVPGKGIWKNTVVNTHYYTFNSERYLTTPSFHKLTDIAATVPFDLIWIPVNTDKYGGGGIYNFWSIGSGGNPASLEVFLHEFGHGMAYLADEYYTSSTGYNDFYDLNTEPVNPNITTLVDFESKWNHMIDEKTPVPTPATEKYNKTVGVYEGGGYLAKGIYRPYINCKMKSLNYDFCPVCQEAIIRVMKTYID